MALSFMSMLGEEADVEKFALIMLGVIVLIVLYGYIGNLLEHKHVIILAFRSTLSMKLV